MECDYLCGWVEVVPYTNMSPKTVNPRDLAQSVEEDGSGTLVAILLHIWHGGWDWPLWWGEAAEYTCSCYLSVVLGLAGQVSIHCDEVRQQNTPSAAISVWFWDWLARCQSTVMRWGSRIHLQLLSQCGSGTGWPGVNPLWWGEAAEYTCSCYLSVVLGLAGQVSIHCDEVRQQNTPSAAISVWFWDWLARCQSTVMRWGSRIHLQLLSQCGSGTGWPGVSPLWWGEAAEYTCSCYLSVVLGLAGQVSVHCDEVRQQNTPAAAISVWFWDWLARCQSTVMRWGSRIHLQLLSQCGSGTGWIHLQLLSQCGSGTGWIHLQLLSQCGSGTGWMHLQLLSQCGSGTGWIRLQLLFQCGSGTGWIHLQLLSQCGSGTGWIHLQLLSQCGSGTGWPGDSPLWWGEAAEYNCYLNVLACQTVRAEQSQG